MPIQDFKAVQTNNGQYDLEIDLEAADFSSVEGFETAISVQLDTDQRVDKEDQSVAQRRQGWMGDILTRDIGYQIGSRLHLKTQSRDTQADRNETAALAKNSLDYLVSIKAAKEVTAIMLGNTIDGKIIIDANNVNRYSRLWRGTRDVEPLPAVEPPVSVQQVYMDYDGDIYTDFDGNQYTSEYIS